MSTELSLAAMDRVLRDQDPLPPNRDAVSIDRRNSDVTHWFNVAVDGQKVLVQMTRGTRGMVSATHRERVEAVILEHADVLRFLLSTPDVHNNMLSIAAQADYLPAPDGKCFQPFRVHFAGESLMKMRDPRVREFLEQIRDAIESDDLAAGGASS